MPDQTSNTDATQTAPVETQTSPGRPERPIDSENQDALERTDFVRRLADALIDPRTKKARGLAIGITGPWGTGKSSVLNLLSRHIKATYDDALVVRFDPWLVSGRNDLISEFLRELIRTIKSEPRLQQQFKDLANTVAKYGEYLAPVAATWVPLLGPVIKGGSGLLKDAVKSDESLTGLRARLMRELSALTVPIVVLIDEIDRVEDDEIRTVAQLVRSVADFPGISYVLAYDQKRVVQALGAGATVTDGQRDERGRAYLEKIVQLQIPLPTIFDNEITRLLTAELSSLREELRLPDNFQSIERFQQLLKILVPDVVGTFRDIGRLVGTFHVLAGMLNKEVDWIDLLGYCTLLIKAPQITDAIKSRPDDFTDDVLSEAAMIRRMVNEKLNPTERLNKIIPSSENPEGIRRLIGFLFPLFSESSNRSRQEDDVPDALYRRRPLLTTLRLGLLPGDYSRAAIDRFLSQESPEIAETIREAYANDTLAHLLDRLDGIYSKVPSINHVAFWKGVGLFLRKPDCEWIASYNPMHEVVQSFAEILERCVLRNESFRSTAMAVFSNLRSDGESELTAHWLRRQIFLHGLFGQEVRRNNAQILTAEQTEALALEMSRAWRSEQLAGQLIPCRWDLQPVYTMINTGIWDEPCKAALDKELSQDGPLDGFTLMLYGGVYTNDRGTVEKMCSYEAYIARVKERLNAEDLHETVRVALRKADGGGW